MTKISVNKRKKKIKGKKKSKKGAAKQYSILEAESERAQLVKIGKIERDRLITFFCEESSL